MRCGAAATAGEAAGRRARVCDGSDAGGAVQAKHAAAVPCQVDGPLLLGRRPTGIIV